MTHLVYDGKNRTIKVLYALAKRAWILDKSFIFESLEFGDWVPEKDHENSQFPEKKLRDACGPLFKDMRFFLNSKDYKTITPQQLSMLIRLSGGKMTESAKDADIIIENGEEKSNILNSKELGGNKPHLISHKWVLDSLTKYSKISYSEYAI
mmetsp:Transcript_41585/g.36978  ORF Transcript_41585/g.36978 Transcript_41585/m.36978 type:complete len:152 (+) Transcript_41585:685-1140(+)